MDGGDYASDEDVIEISDGDGEPAGSGDELYKVAMWNEMCLCKVSVESLSSGLNNVGHVTLKKMDC